MFFAVIVVANAGCGAKAGRPANADAKAPSAQRVVVMISLDGLGAYYLDDPKAEIPTLRELAAKGACASGMRPSTPSVTWPNHASLMTGCEPARHGVVGNNYLDRATGKHVTLIGDPTFDKSDLVKVPTIYDLAKRAGWKTAAIRWPASRNADTLDWNVPDTTSAEDSRKHTTPGLFDECKAAGIPLEGVLDRKSLPEGVTITDRDEVFTKAFQLVLEKHRPGLAMLHLADIDHDEHLYGPRSPEAYARIKKADACVRAIWDQLQREYGPDRATIVIVSDHGFSPIQQQLYPYVLLRKAGIVDVKGIRVVSENVRLVFQGGSAMVYLTAKDDAERNQLVERVTRAFDGAEGYERIVPPSELSKYGVGDSKVDPHAPDMLIFCKMGSIFGDTAAGDLPFREKPERKGSHGHDPDFPDLQATFIACGAGIKPGVNVGQIRNTDVAPTVANLMGLEMKDVDGKVLEAALSK
jgi:predicted AlkP superfamily pyrophosphatase or phosphodiesterase